MLHQTNLSLAAQPVTCHDHATLAAVSAELSKLPASIRNATLDQIAGSPSTWGAAVGSYCRASEAMNGLLSGADDGLVSSHSSLLHQTLTAMLLTPAPTLEALGYKLRVYGEQDGYELIEADEIGKVLAADVERLIPHPTVETDADWAFWTKCLRDIRANYLIRGLADDVVDALADAETAATQKLIELPNRDAADVITKVRALSRLNTMVQVADLEPLMAELEAFTIPLAQPAPVENAALVAAFTGYMEGLTDLRAAPADADETKLFDALAPAEMAILRETAHTPAGVAMKLKHALVGLAPEAWGTQALFDSTSAAFREGFAVADHYQQVLWSAISDLDSIVTGDRAEAAE